MTDSPGLATPSLEVTLDDGRVLTVKVLNPDYLRFDRTAALHKWPTAQAAPFLWLTFLAWAALIRTGALGESPPEWQEFADKRCLYVRALDENGLAVEGGSEQLESVDPTPQGAAPA